MGDSLRLVAALRAHSDTEPADGGLRLQGIEVRFGGLRVLNQVSFDVQQGTVAGVIGPNGAGKTTLLNAISGVLQPQQGDVSFAGRSVNALAAHERARLGIARTYQIVRPLRHLSVVENVMVGALYGRGRCRSLRRARRTSLALLARVGLEHRADIPATSISSGQQKLMDLARALAMEPALLIMDEPLAALTEENQAIVLRTARDEAGNGCGVLIIEHLVGAVSSIAERLIVLDRGTVIADGPAKEVLERSHVIEAYLGTTQPPTMVGTTE